MTTLHVLFFSTHHALWAEEVLRTAGMTARVVAVPRRYSSDCGYCVRVVEAPEPAIAAALAAAGVEYDRIVRDTDGVSS
ncbi:MAG TPA: DUF3343 domain-containing protein [Candidatus Krumholzibacteria bacterium]|nr:DUF3343 domain-containing protein [Candidatus Krumholzibacteria bacterium]HPD72683.1 DUF3343 domain-containing protein [Candidatus Krumholzibacteria bacterium]HRY40385.1 DUF3343 domain-containing protein [Candidatus Krumholzibacteria bacterium]